MKVLHKGNKTLKQKTLGSREYKHMEVRECNAQEVDVNQVGRKKMYIELQRLVSKYKEMAKLIGRLSTTKQLLH